MPKRTEKPFAIPKLLVWEAWRQVKANKGAPGVDGQDLEEFETDLADNLGGDGFLRRLGSVWGDLTVKQEIARPCREASHRAVAVREPQCVGLAVAPAHLKHQPLITRAVRPNASPPRRRWTPKQQLSASVRQILDAFTAAAVFVGNDPLDILAANALGYAPNSRNVRRPAPLIEHCIRDALAWRTPSGREGSHTHAWTGSF